jgi:hypothetical protein
MYRFFPESAGVISEPSEKGTAPTILPLARSYTKGLRSSSKTPTPEITGGAEKAGRRLVEFD